MAYVSLAYATITEHPMAYVTMTEYAMACVPMAYVTMALCHHDLDHHGLSQLGSDHRGLCPHGLCLLAYVSLAPHARRPSRIPPTTTMGSKICRTTHALYRGP